jgi:hypothetical protein
MAIWNQSMTCSARGMQSLGLGAHRFAPVGDEGNGLMVDDALGFQNCRDASMSVTVEAMHKRKQRDAPCCTVACRRLPRTNPRCGWVRLGSECSRRRVPL